MKAELDILSDHDINFLTAKHNENQWVFFYWTYSYIHICYISFIIKMNFHGSHA